MKEGPDGGQHIGALSADAIRSERQAFSLIPHDNTVKLTGTAGPMRNASAVPTTIGTCQEVKN
jgi:hypothetical protein